MASSVQRFFGMHVRGVRGEPAVLAVRLKVCIKLFGILISSDTLYCCVWLLLEQPCASFVVALSDIFFFILLAFTDKEKRETMIPAGLLFQVAVIVLL